MHWSAEKWAGAALLLLAWGCATNPKAAGPARPMPGGVPGTIPGVSRLKVHAYGVRLTLDPAMTPEAASRPADREMDLRVGMSFTLLDGDSAWRTYQLMSLLDDRAVFLLRREVDRQSQGLGIQTIDQAITVASYGDESAAPENEPAGR